ncbi:MAG: hypothetical protein A3B10_00690 [Candidatus Doudnabacteria bacterium RIFCSPLOWO2_01_FULL_44_21]|uniref:Uncharacterized protein n=1 Tax=Candidatus Doudnabacteria bacterium RIFCSPLOWO2_01_FULL_44_21 TaxID=1817841 RepID=A0A1F5PXL4_9BACT|nr:MAG: hypothetical protein A3B95_00550 [Candidatus Doudnabacteria bacterium RIFCSPHIGHO2_02_FULL_43_13b]OGE94655.1 MAG: hypothetical protein A3B10_00690 [Candidatus Doudnabacteria bacterium RIFCSPLOWO2_01_FULL_44_21]
MRNLFNERTHKYISILIVTFGAFFGFEAVSYAIGIYQLNSSLYLSLYIYAFHIFWLTFLFDLHFKKRGVLAIARLNHQGLKMFWEAFKDRIAHVRKWEYFRHYQNYLVLPGVLYWGVVVLLFLNPFKYGLKQMIILSGTFAMSVAYWYMKEHISRQLEHQASWIKVLAMVKLFAAFLIYSALLGVTLRYGFEAWFLVAATLTITFLLVYQALFQHRLLTFDTFLWVVIIAFVVGLVSIWVYSHWNTQYFTGGLVMLAVYNTLWGLLHHYLEHTLSRKIVFEYLLMMIFIISFLLASHNFNQKVI